jgi:Uma2 family endonuclease
MLMGKSRVSDAAFQAFIDGMAGSGRIFERIEGEIIEKMPTFGYSSGVSARLTTLIGMLLLRNPIAHLTDAQGGYDVDGENRLVPDIGVILKTRLPELPKLDYIPMPPDMVIEVVSQSDLKDPEKRIETKRGRYLAAGVRIVWYVFYERREVEVNRPGQPMRVFRSGETLDGGDVLPDLRILVDDIFPD